MKARLTPLCLFLFAFHSLSAQLKYERVTTDQWKKEDGMFIRLQMTYPVFSGDPLAEALNEGVQRQVADIRSESGIKESQKEKAPEAQPYRSYTSYELNIHVSQAYGHLITLECWTDYDMASPKHGGDENFDVLMMESSTGRWVDGRELVSADLLDSLGKLVYESMRTDERYMLRDGSVDPWSLGIGANDREMICYVPAYHCMDDATYVVVRLPWEKVRGFLAPRGVNLLQLK